jgi:hypothetical protein
MSKWIPPDRVVEAEQRLSAAEPVYRALLATLRHLGGEDEKLPCEAAVVALVDLAVDVAAASGLLWQHPDLVDARHRLAASLDERRKREPAPPVISKLAAVLSTGRTPEST